MLAVGYEHVAVGSKLYVSVALDVVLAMDCEHRCGQF